MLANFQSRYGAGLDFVCIGIKQWIFEATALAHICDRTRYLFRLLPGGRPPSGDDSQWDSDRLYDAMVFAFVDAGGSGLLLLASF